MRPDWSRARVVRDLHAENAFTYIHAREARDAVFRSVRQKAAAMLSARGLRAGGYARVATFEVPKLEPIAHGGLLGRLLNLVAPRVSAEEYEGYEIIVESWDDGNNSNWEGNVWVEQLSSGHWMSNNEQQQLDTEPYWSNWADEVSTNMQPPQRCRKAGSACGYCAETSAIRCNLQRALDDRWPYCVGGAGACVLSGVAWPKCAGIFCYGQIFGGWLWQTKQHLQAVPAGRGGTHRLRGLGPVVNPWKEHYSG